NRIAVERKFMEVRVAVRTSGKVVTLPLFALTPPIGGPINREPLWAIELRWQLGRGLVAISPGTWRPYFRRNTHTPRPNAITPIRVTPTGSQNTWTSLVFSLGRYRP